MIGDRIIELSPRGVAALLAPINGHGGFQTFLERLRSGVNRETRELTVRFTDWQQMQRYVEYAHGDGGFQGRMRRILQGVRVLHEVLPRVPRERECSSCWRVMSPAEWHGQLICDDCASGRTGPVFDRDGVRIATFEIFR